eukprot:CAMPEP_0197856382 /NCGR_PEP_ID=MMETSP1438-20131217/28442_1 /TAXON_ID=1461541 /ORGANISM="Pterosperma sp., Strain CCMP1384" /LENGTH=269 /DNA_ID=CAMNT_0043471817 /DNA_START=65 /DNA_END=874 /DNA_ORIENTATION=+
MDVIEKTQANFTAKYNDFVKGKPAAEVAAATLGGGAQGGVMGFLFGKLGSIQPPPGSGPPPPTMGMMQGGPWLMARNFACLTGVTQGLTVAIKQYRNGVEDWKGSACASFGGGAAYSLSSNLGAPKGVPLIPGGPLPATTPGAMAMDAVRTGLAFAVLQSAFYYIGEQFTGGASKPEEDVQYRAVTDMLRVLGLEQYDKNFRKGKLTDSTLMLLTESTLQEIKIPPGPRLLILNHTAQAKAHVTRLQKEGKQPVVGSLSLAMPIEIIHQ